MPKGATPGEFEQTVLLALARAGDGQSGRVVYEEILRLTDRDMALASVHVTLARLESKGLVDSVLAAAGPGRRRAKHFQLTRAGADALRRARQHWDVLWAGAVAHPWLRDD